VVNLYSWSQLKTALYFSFDHSSVNVLVVNIKRNNSCFLFWSLPYAGGFLFFLDKKKKPAYRQAGKKNQGRRPARTYRSVRAGITAPFCRIAMFNDSATVTSIPNAFGNLYS